MVDENREPYPAPGTKRPDTLEQGPNEQSIVASGMTVEEWKKKHPRQRLGPNPEEVGQMTTDPPDGSEPQPDPIYPGTFSSVDPDGSKTRADNQDPLIPPGGLTGLTILTPEDGATVPAVHDVAGGGAEPGAAVELWASDNESSPVATTTAGANGAWAFAGDTPARPGELTWRVVSGESSDEVTITVEEEDAVQDPKDPNAPQPEPAEQPAPAPEDDGGDDEGGEEEGDDGPSPWSSMTRHADIDAFVEEEQLEVPDDWASKTVAQKKAWLDEASAAV